MTQPNLAASRRDLHARTLLLLVALAVSAAVTGLTVWAR